MKYKFFIFLIFFVSFLLAGQTNAAELYFKGPQEVEVGDRVTIQVVVSPGDEFINAIEGKIIFDQKNLRLEDISDGSSIIPLWVEKPELTEPGKIKFSGIIPGGFGPILSKEGKIIDLFFTAKKEGQIAIFFEDYQVFLHQSELGLAETNARSILLNILPLREIKPSEKEPLILDFYPPESFKIHIEKNPAFFNNKYVAIFSTQDKESGLDHYEVQELFLGFFGKWETAESPYPLHHQSLFSIIKVKAVDRIGRERIEMVISTQFAYLIGGVLLGIIILLLWFILRKIIRKPII